MAVDGSLNFDTRINQSGFEKGIDSMKNGIGKLTASMKSLAQAAASAFGISDISSFIKESRALWETQLEAEARLEQVMKNTTGATQEQIQATKDWASALQEVGVIGDEIQLAGLQELGTYIENADSLKTLNVVLNDMLAQQYGFNATSEAAVTISTMLGKVLEGQTGALSRYGYSFTEAQEQLLKYGTEEQRVATLAEVVSESVGGMNEALAKTPAGRLKQVSNTMGDIKEQFGKAFTNLGTILLPALEKLAQMLAKASEYAVKLSNELVKIFGAESENTVAVSGSVSDAVTEQNALTDAVLETNKAQEKSLAGFDKMNKLSSGKSESNEEESVESMSIKPVITDNTAEETASRFSEKFEKFLEPIKLVWEDKSPELKKNFRDTVDSLSETWSGLKTQFSEAWTENDRGLRIFSGILDIVGSISGTISDIAGSTADWAKNIDFGPVLESIAGLFEEIKPLTDTVGDTLSWHYKNVLLPLGKWTIEKAVPASINLLSAAIKFLNSVISTLKPLAQFLIEKFLKPIASWTGGIIISVLNGICTVLSSLADWIKEHQTLCENLIIVIGSVAAAIGIVLGAPALGGVIVALPLILGQILRVTAALIANAAAWVAANLPIVAVTAAIAAVIAIGVLLIKHWDEVKEFALGVWEEIQERLWAFFDNVKIIFNKLYKVAANTWKNIKKAFSDVGNWFKNQFTLALNNVKSAWSSAVSWFADVWNGIMEVFSAVGTWFRNRFAEAWENITGIFSSLGSWFSDRWNDIVYIFSAVGTWFGNRFTEAWNGIVNAFSNVGNFFGGIWDTIRNCFSHVTEWFRNTFSSAWQAVKDVFSKGGEIFTGITDGIFDTFKTVVNGLIGGINNVISKPFEAVNSALDKIKNVSIAGAHPFRRIPHIDVPQIPYLAQGTVVPANYGEFLAVLGDNKREPEIVSPESTIEAAVLRAMNKVGQQGGDIHIHVDIDGREIGRIAVRAVDLDNARRGRK